MDRQDAWATLCEFTAADTLRKHGLAVEAAMRAYARRFGEDEEAWAIVGLLHDFDYEIHPTEEQHPEEGAQILRARGWPEPIIHAIRCHAPYTTLTRDAPMDRAIYAVDELAGFVVAVALVRPGKSIDEVDVAAVKKKLKDKGFARSVNRTDIFAGAEVLGVELDDHMETVIAALKPHAATLGIAGEARA